MGGSLLSVKSFDGKAVIGSILAVAPSFAIWPINQSERNLTLSTAGISRPQ
jgi:hypothetical protein